jgi:hypothetical protein
LHQQSDGGFASNYSAMAERYDIASKMLSACSVSNAAANLTACARLRTVNRSVRHWRACLPRPVTPLRGF